MQKAILELHYLPCIQYFTKLLRHPVVVIEQQENYQKRSYRNRCVIAAANGPLVLSIPLSKGKNQQQAIREVELNYQEDWLGQHWKSIQSAYGKSPFFEYYADDLQPFYQQKQSGLFEWNKELLETLLALLQIPVQLEWSEVYDPQPSQYVDLRNSILPPTRQQQIDPHFHPQAYPQAFVEKSGFLPNLSILDLLFCTGPESISILAASIVE